MTTKEQELKALDKIRAIIAGLGEDSYIGTAFDGCLEDAEENIQNDFALSMKDRWQSAEQKLIAAKADAQQAHDALDRTMDKLLDKEEERKTAKSNADAWMEKAVTAENAAAEAAQKISDLELEIVHLKAKLYDMMMAGA